MRARQRAEMPYWPGQVPFRHSWMKEMLEDGLRRANMLPE
jgi:hypothetical protein